jgi:hypothetical protein
MTASAAQRRGCADCMKNCLSETRLRGCGAAER